MNREIGRIVKLDNKEYLIVSKITYDKNDYLYLMTIDKPVEVKIALEQVIDHDLIEVLIVENKELRREIYNKFVEEASK